MREPLRNRIEPDFDGLFRTPRRKRKLSRDGWIVRCSGRRLVDLLAGAVALAVVLLVFVNALFLQKVSSPARLSPPVAQKPMAPAGAPLPQPRPDAVTGRSRSDLLRDVQLELANHGYYDGAVDGAAGPRIAQAIRNFEIAQRLRVTGEPTELLLAQIRKADPKSEITGSVQAQSGSSSQDPKIISAQRLLARYGYGPVRINGVADKDTHEAVARFERDRNMPQTGEVSERLLRELAAFSGGGLN